jgi:hypothetical protein
VTSDGEDHGHGGVEMASLSRSVLPKAEKNGPPLTNSNPMFQGGLGRRTSSNATPYQPEKLLSRTSVPSNDFMSTQGMNDYLSGGGDRDDTQGNSYYDDAGPGGDSRSARTRAASGIKRAGTAHPASRSSLLGLPKSRVKNNSSLLGAPKHTPEQAAAAAGSRKSLNSKRNSKVLGAMGAIIGDRTSRP